MVNIISEFHFLAASASVLYVHYLPYPNTLCHFHLKYLLISSICPEQAQVMLSEIYPGVSPKRGPTYWDQILEVGVISVSRRVLKRLNELLDKVIWLATL